MEKLNLLEDRVVFGLQVKTFPIGIGQAFDGLADKIQDGRNRPYYGISWMEGDEVIYYAMAGEKYAGEAVQYNYKIMEIERGDYIVVTVNDWQSKTDKLKDVFHEMMQNKETDNSKPCIEWYKSHDEMLCMMKAI
jgi:predicted transcriptional regulator YdeE